MVFALLACFVIGFVGPVVLMIVNAFRVYSMGTYGGFTLDNLIKVVVDPQVWQAFGNSLLLAFIVVAICLLIGYPIGLLFIRSGRRVRAVILILVIAPLLVNGVVRTFGWIILFSPGGLVDSLTGVTLYHTMLAVGIAMVHLYLAYMVLSLVTSLSAIPADLMPAADTLGATPWFGFRHVILPLSVPGLISGSIIVFGNAMGSVIAPMLLGGTTLPLPTILIYRQMQVFFAPGVAAILALVLLIINILAVVAGEALVRRLAGMRRSRKVA